MIHPTLGNENAATLDGADVFLLEYRILLPEYTTGRNLVEEICLPFVF